MEIEYLQVKNWTRYQHFGGAALNGGVPPWIKLYVSVLDDYLFCQLTDSEKCHLMLIWVLAARLHNRIPNDPVWLKKQINVTCDIEKSISRLKDYGFLEIVTEIKSGIYRNPEIPNTVSCRRDKKRGEEIRREENLVESQDDSPTDDFLSIVTDKKENLPGNLDNEKFMAAWEMWIRHRKEIGKPVKPTSMKATLEKLSQFGPEVSEQAIIQSISNGWQGLFPEKIGSNGTQQTKSTPLVEAFKGVNPGGDWVSRIDPDYYRTHKKERR